MMHEMLTIHQLEWISSRWGEDFLWLWKFGMQEKNVALDSWCRKSGEAVEYHAYTYMYYWANYSDLSQGTQMVGFVRESPQNPLNSGLGIIVICPDVYTYLYIYIYICLPPWLPLPEWFGDSSIHFYLSNMSKKRDLQQIVTIFFVKEWLWWF